MKDTFNAQKISIPIRATSKQHNAISSKSGNKRATDCGNNHNHHQVSVMRKVAKNLRECERCHKFYGKTYFSLLGKVCINCRKKEKAKTEEKEADVMAAMLRRNFNHVGVNRKRLADMAIWTGKSRKTSKQSKAA